MSVGAQLKRLGSQSAIYGIGGILSRLIAVALLPVYTGYLGTKGFGRIETIIALTGVLTILLRFGITSAFFRFYFDAETDAERTLVVRTAFWFTMATATLGLVLGLVFAPQLSGWLKLSDPWLVRAGFVGLWAQMNYAQMTSVFRVEQRPVSFAIASVANVLITIGSTIALVVGAHKGAVGAVVGNFLGTLSVYLVLLGYRRYQLGLQFDRELFRRMNSFGMPLVPAALFLWAINFSDRLFIVHFRGQAEVGIYSLAVRIASVIVFLMTAFQLAWPAFAYSIKDDDEAKRTYSFVLTYLLFVTCWIALALGALAPWIVDVLATGKFDRAAEAVPLLAFATAAYAGYSVLAIGIGRARKTQRNWIVAGAAAVLNVALNLVLIPRYGMMGAAAATVVAYVALFVAMWLNSRSVYPVAYQWRRVLTVAAAAVGLTALVRATDAPLAVAILLVLAYPLVLAALGFYLPAERARIRRLVTSRA
jgi:O-antigen/teichoic acid export membrane protein